MKIKKSSHKTYVNCHGTNRLSLYIIVLFSYIPYICLLLNKLCYICWIKQGLLLNKHCYICRLFGVKAPTVTLCLKYTRMVPDNNIQTLKVGILAMGWPSLFWTLKVAILPMDWPSFLPMHISVWPLVTTNLCRLLHALTEWRTQPPACMPPL